MVKQKVLYGAGKMGKRAFEHYTKENPDAVFCFVDTYKHGTEYLGKSVLSFDELLPIYKSYDLVICIFDLFEVVYNLKNAGIKEYVIWTDGEALPSVDYLRKKLSEISLSKAEDGRKKIIYGAGVWGKIALAYYGNDNVYAFADVIKAGGVYFEKPILKPSDLKPLQNDYDIIISVRAYDSAEKCLQDVGVTKYRSCFGVGLDDFRITDVITKSSKNLNKLEKVNDLDFIQNPEIIYDYKKYIVMKYRALVSKQKHVISVGLSDNDMYGYYDELKNYAGRCNEPYESPAVSHGVADWTVMGVTLGHENVIGVGDFNKQYFHGISKDALVFSVGPYINYARQFYDIEEYNLYKQKLGKNLLVFAAHTLPNYVVSYDYREFVSCALEDAKKFDSITVCTHFNDISSPLTDMFRAEGANIVCAGLQYDTSFVRRLKTIISCSDAVLVNSIGTHVVFSMGLNKPLKRFAQNMGMDTINISSKVLKSSSPHGVFSEMLKSLSTTHYEITDKQKNVFELLGGFHQLKSKEEMGAIFDLSKRIVQNCDYKQSKFIDSIRSTYRELRNGNTNEDRLHFELMKDALPSDYEEYIGLV